MQKNYTALNYPIYPEDIECVYIHNNERGAIYVSNVEASQNIKTLKKYNIKGVLTACKGVYLSHPKSQVPYYLYVPGEDHERFNLSQYFHESVEFIKEVVNRGFNVLVHCMAGISRSAALVLAYLMKYEKLGLREALFTIKQKRKIINPNRGFMRQLQTYEERLPNRAKKHFSHSTKKINRSFFAHQPPSTHLDFYPKQKLEKGWSYIKYTPTSGITDKKTQQKYHQIQKNITHTNQNPESPLKKDYRSFQDLNKQLDQKIAQIRKKYSKAADYLHKQSNTIFSKYRSIYGKPPLTPTQNNTKGELAFKNASLPKKSYVSNNHLRGFSQVNPSPKYQTLNQKPYFK